MSITNFQLTQIISLGILICNFKDIIYGSATLKILPYKFVPCDTRTSYNSPKYLSYQGQNLVSDLQPELDFTQCSLCDKQIPEEKDVTELH